VNGELTSALWGLALLASFVGWGRWIAVALRVRARAHLGLELTWGFAGTLSAGGWLCAFGLAQKPVLAALVGLGGFGLLFPTRREPTRDSPAHSSQRIALALFCFALLGVGFVIALLDRGYHVPDDHAAYLFHARKLIDTGSLHEPFSFRRLASYGGQTFLHALLLVVAPVEHLNLIDKGICRLGIALVVLAHLLAYPRRSLLAAAVAVYGVAAYPNIALNTSSIFSGVLAFAGLWITLELCRRMPERPIANGVLTGLALGAALPLRQNYALACALLVGLEHARRFAAARDRRQGKELLAAALAGAVCMGGWALLQLHSSGTAVFPILPGFANPDWSVLSSRSLAEFARALENHLHWPLLSIQLVMCGLVLVRAERSPESESLAPLAGSALIAFAGNAWLLAHAGPSDLSRYTTAFLLPVVLIGSARAAAPARVRNASALRDPRTWTSAACLLALFLLLPPIEYVTNRALVLKYEIDSSEQARDVAGRARHYERLQNAAPQGERLLVMLDEPFLLDLRRNDVVSLDLPGGASPPPGLWAMNSAGEVVSYLRGLGYPWLAAIRPERAPPWSLYRRKRWVDHANGVPTAHTHPSDLGAWVVMGQTVVRFFDWLEVITHSCRLSYDDRTFVMIDLSRCRFDPAHG
jgi:hypothetical protein